MHYVVKISSDRIRTYESESQCANHCTRQRVAFCTSGLANIEHMNAKLNMDGIVLQIDGLRVQEVTRCHVTLRQLDARESPAVNKYIVVDLSSDSAMQALLKQVCT